MKHLARGCDWDHILLNEGWTQSLDSQNPGIKNDLVKIGLYFHHDLGDTYKCIPSSSFVLFLVPING
jgi:hypothetical protein